MTLTHSQIKNELGRAISVKFSDSTYVLPSYSYVTEEFLPWFRGYLQRRRMVYSGERFDCDDFANEFAARLREAGLGSKEKAGVAVATMQVTNLRPSFGIGAGKHMLNLVGVKTENGHNWLVIEPQNQKHVFLQDYKNAVDLFIAF